jgi:hypothetical protein
MSTAPDASPSPLSPFAGDRPWTAGDKDSLRRTAFANRIADTIAIHPSRDGLVIGVYGPWGEGKTSVLHMVEERLKERRVETMWFNPWYFREQDELIHTFLNQLAARVEAKLGTRADEFKRVLKKYGSLLSALPTTIAGVDTGAPLKAVSDQIGGSTIEDLKNQLGRILAEKQIDVVVFMDDIDRLDRREIQSVLKLVKLTGGFSHVTYILAFDDEMVAAAVGEAYGHDTEAGRNFLEKIVQVPLRLPRIDGKTGLHLTLGEVDHALTVTDTADDITEQQVLTFRRYFDPLYEATPRTLRAAKRYGNALTFALPLLKGEANTGDLLLLEALRIFTPRLYGMLPRYKKMLVESAERPRKREARAKSWRRLLMYAPASDRKAAVDILEHLFPRVKEITQNMGYGSDWNVRWAREQRVSSPDYFERYFQYAVPSDDASDVGVGQLLAALEGGQLVEALRLFDDLLTGGNAGRLVEKLRLSEDMLTPIAAKTLIRLLVHRGGGLPRPRGAFHFEVPQFQAVILAIKALRRLPEGERMESALEVVSEPTELNFAVEFFRHVRYRPSEGDKPHDRVLDSDAEAQVTKVIEGRLSTAMANRPFYMEPSSEERFLLGMWGHLAGHEATQTFLAARFSRAPKEAASFVTAMARQSWSLDSGLPLPAEIEREEYDAITRLIDAVKVIESLRRAYGDAVEVSRDEEFDEDSAGRMPLELLLARRFIHLHELLEARKRQTADSTDGKEVEGADEAEEQAPVLPSPD